MKDQHFKGTTVETLYSWPDVVKENNIDMSVADAHVVLFDSPNPGDGGGRAKGDSLCCSPYSVANLGGYNSYGLGYVITHEIGHNLGKMST